MNQLSVGTFAKKRIIVYFLLAGILPVFLVGYLGYSTLTTRREAVKNVLSSNLWISAEAAMRSVEDAFLEREKIALSPERFSRLVEMQDPADRLTSTILDSGIVRGRLFLVDGTCRILAPSTAGEVGSLIPWPESPAESGFSNTLARAESLEFTDRNYALATGVYRQSASFASTGRQKAMALEGLGRCLVSLRRYEAAFEVYRRLSSDHAWDLNQAGHPSGLVALFRMSEIDRRRGNETGGYQILLGLYQ